MPASALRHSLSRNCALLTFTPRSEPLEWQAVPLTVTEPQPHQKLACKLFWAVADLHL